MKNSLLNILYLTRAALLLCIFLCISADVFGYRCAKVIVNANPASNGAVYVGTNNSAGEYKSPSDDAKQEYWGVGGHSFTFYLFAQANPGYKFTNWSNGGAASVTVAGAILENNATYTYDANFAPIDYSIRFNGNGATGGIMSNLAMKYATAKNLTANAYTRAYTVSYNANGGSCATSSATATYSFKNWNTNAAGTGTTYTAGQSVNNLTTTDGAVVDLYAQWTSSSVTLPAATKAGCVLDGWYSGDTKIGEPGDSYTPTANITLTAK